MIPLAERRRRIARKRYWTARIEKEQRRAIEPWHRAASLAWRAIVGHTPVDSVRPEKLADQRGSDQDDRLAIDALWWLLAGALPRADYAIQKHYEPAMKGALNASVPLYDRLAKTPVRKS